MATVALQSAGFAAALGAVANLRPSAQQPNEINVTASGSTRKAVAYPILREVQYDQAFDGGAAYIWDLIVLAAPGQSTPVLGQQAIDPYIERTGADSIPTALYNARTLPTNNAATCDDLKVTRAYDRGLIEVNGQQFWGCKLEVMTFD